MRLFPKQTSVDSDRLGNWLVMPYFGDTFGGKLKLQHGLKKTGADMTVAEFVMAAEEARTSMDEVVRMCGVACGRRPPNNGALPLKRYVTDFHGEFGDGPPCLQRLTASGPLRDWRKRTLFMLAVYYKRCDQNNWKRHVESANQKFFAPPLPSDEVVGVVRSVAKKEYQYTCHEQPMRSNCDSALCRGRPFGVGEAQRWPVIVSILKIESEEPVWQVQLQGLTRLLEIRRSDELHNFRKFNQQCLAHLNVVFAPMKEQDWLALLSDALKNNFTEKQEEITLTREGQFRELLEEFLTNRSRGERREDLLSGRPWEDDEAHQHLFVMKHLHKFVKQEGFRDMSRPEMQKYIRALGGGIYNKTISGRRMKVWWVPSESIQEMPEVSPPPLTPAVVDG